MSQELERAKEIYKALKQHNRKAAKDYLDGFDRRDQINTAILEETLKNLDEK